MPFRSGFFAVELLLTKFNATNRRGVAEDAAESWNEKLEKRFQIR